MQYVIPIPCLIPCIIGQQYDFWYLYFFLQKCKQEKCKRNKNISTSEAHGRVRVLKSSEEFTQCQHMSYMDQRVLDKGPWMLTLDFEVSRALGIGSTVRHLTCLRKLTVVQDQSVLCSVFNYLNILRIIQCKFSIFTPKQLTEWQHNTCLDCIERASRCRFGTKCCAYVQVKMHRSTWKGT